MQNDDVASAATEEEKSKLPAYPAIEPRLVSSL